ncbi:hypothetical protein HYW99_03475 [Candidatus Woesearchaeota archaeon]|nr:hypothetical protein [Candidatus Woesearchaeota archaeon]
MVTKTVEMIVSLKIPDATAITALQTLQRIGFNKIKDIKRADYYKFIINGDEEKFKDRISKVDILVNVNKHFFEFEIKKNANIKILVKNIDGNDELLETLKNRLGFFNILNVEKSILWSLSIDADDKVARKIAERAAKELLVNEHYQEYGIL